MFLCILVPKIFQEFPRKNQSKDILLKEIYPIIVSIRNNTNTNKMIVSYLRNYPKLGKFQFSSSTRGFMRSGVGVSMDSLQEYVDKSIQSEQVIANLESITSKYIEAISQNDRVTIEQVTKKSLNDKTLEWMNEVAKKGEQFQLLGKENPSTSLQGFTSYSYLYGLRNELNNKEFEKWRVYNLNKNFLVKRLLFIEGLKVHRLFTQKSIAVEAFIYSNLRLQLKKESKQQHQQQQSHQYVGYKVCYVCDGKLEQNEPFSLLQNDKKQNLFELNSWKIADINDWVNGDIQSQDFSKWAYSILMDQNIAESASVKATITK